MFEANTDLRLFGYDLRLAGGFFRSGVAQLFWDNDSPIRQKLDEPVLASILSPAEIGAPQALWFRGSQLLAEVEDGGAEQGVQGSRSADSGCRAIVLPDELVLHRTITLPPSLSGSVFDAVSMDVKAFSPFPDDDTAFGWRTAGVSAESIEVDIAIVSRAAVARVLREIRGEGVSEDIHAQEVWSFTPGSQAPVVFQGFGEGVRNTLYRRRLLRMGAAVCALVAGVALAPLLSGILLSMRADSLETQVNALKASTADELSMREELTVVRELGERIALEVSGQADFGRELTVITQKIPDSAFANGVELIGQQLRVTGLADDAASLMAQLSEYSGYSKVVNRGGFRRDRSGKERYSFEISLGEAVADGDAG